MGLYLLSYDEGGGYLLQNSLPFCIGNSLLHHMLGRSMCIGLCKYLECSPSINGFSTPQTS